jgi:hypothetical protein
MVTLFAISSIKTQFQNYAFKSIQGNKKPFFKALKLVNPS